MYFANIQAMPEGPSIVILKEAVQSFKRKRIIQAKGNARIDLQRLEGRTIRDLKTWGKHFLICFDDFFLRIHLLMFGTYRINEEKELPPRLSLNFKKGVLNFYTCAIQMHEGSPDDVYDWSADVMNPQWDSRKAMKKLKDNPEMLVCDALLDQNIFSGVGNIIKCEVLFRAFIHPASTLGALPIKQRRALIKATVDYAFDFLEWKKEFTLKKHWLAYGKKICPRCDVPLLKEYLGKTDRRTFFCSNCQVLYELDA